MYKRRFKGNRYTKLANINDKTLSNEHVHNFVSASNKKIKSSVSDVAHPTNINNNSPAIAVTTDTEMSKTSMTANTFMSDSSVLLIDRYKYFERHYKLCRYLLVMSK